jgi:hypothetical protein
MDVISPLVGIKTLVYYLYRPMEKPQEHQGANENQRAIDHINMLVTQAGQFGGNSSEIPEMYRLIEQLTRGDIDASTAIAHADDMFHSKNGMHDMYR